MTRVGAKKRRRLAATAALLCALVASLTVAVGPAAAEEGDSAPLRPVSDGGFYFPDIHGATDPEEYPIQWGNLSPELSMRQVDEHEIVVEYPEYGVKAYSIEAPLAHDAEGATVPTSIVLSEPDVVTIVVHHRVGNPAKGGAPFVYPIIGGAGWEGGYRTISVPLGEPLVPEPIPSAPTPCTVPSLHGLSLRTAKARLRAAHCSIGRVRLAPYVSDSKGKVVKQFHPVGTDLAAGAPVAVKLGLGLGR